MDYNFNDRLCGATFFAVLLDAAKPQLSSKEKWQGNSNGITQPKMFAALIKIANPDITSDFNSDSYEKTFAKYKRCDSSSSPMYFPLTDLTFRNGFDARVKDNYTAAQNDMFSFIRTFLDYTDTNKIKKLVGTLQELIAKDDGITHTFYMGTDLAKGDCYPSAVFFFNTEVLNSKIAHIDLSRLTIGRIIQFNYE